MRMLGCEESCFVASSITLSLLESPLKPILYFFEVALILTVYHAQIGNCKKTTFETKGIVFINM